MGSLKPHPLPLECVAFFVTKESLQRKFRGVPKTPNPLCPWRSNSPRAFLMVKIAHKQKIGLLVVYCTSFFISKVVRIVLCFILKVIVWEWKTSFFRQQKSDCTRAGTKLQPGWIRCFSLAQTKNLSRLNALKWNI